MIRCQAPYPSNPSPEPFSSGLSDPATSESPLCFAPSITRIAARNGTVPDEATPGIPSSLVPLGLLVGFTNSFITLRRI